MGHLIGSAQLERMRKTGHTVRVSHSRLVNTPDGYEYMTRSSFERAYPEASWSKALVPHQKTELAVASTSVVIYGPNQETFSGTRYIYNRQFNRRDALGRAATEAYFRMVSAYPEHDPFVNMVE